MVLVACVIKTGCLSTRKTFDLTERLRREFERGHYEGHTRQDKARQLPRLICERLKHVGA